MPKNAANEAAKKRAAKEKKMLVVLALVLVVALGYAYKTLTKLHGAAPTPNIGATTTSSAGSSTPPATSSSSATSGAAAAASGSTASGGSGHLISAVTPSLDQGQLRTFTLFAGKDPFFADGPRAAGTSGSGSGYGSGSGGSTASRGSKPPASSAPSKPAGFQSKPRVAPPSSAVIAVNGMQALVPLDSDFPATGDPTTIDLFRLVALTQTTAKVAVVDGSYASGAATLTLRVGKPVTLANVKDGARYVLELFPQGTTPTAPSAPTTTTTPATLSTPPTS